jgi:amiloride-sensitive sodium channel
LNATIIRQFCSAHVLASIGGLLGLGLGMSFISVIEILYYVFFRRLFLWQRVKWLRLSIRMTRIFSRNSKEERKGHDPVSFDAAQNNNIIWPSSTTLTSTVSTISSPTLNHPVPFTRRYSLNLPPHLQKQLSKY